MTTRIDPDKLDINLESRARYIIAISGNLQSCQYTQFVHRSLTDFLDKQSNYSTSVYRQLNQRGLVPRRLWSFDFGDIELAPNVVASERAYSENIAPTVCEFFNNKTTPVKSVKSLANTMGRRGGNKAIHKWSCAEKKALLYYEVNSELLNVAPASECKEGVDHVNLKEMSPRFRSLMDNFYRSVITSYLNRGSIVDITKESSTLDDSFSAIRNEKDLMATLKQKTVGGLFLRPSDAMRSFAGHLAKSEKEHSYGHRDACDICRTALCAIHASHEKLGPEVLSKTSSPTPPRNKKRTFSRRSSGGYITPVGSPKKKQRQTTPRKGTEKKLSAAKDKRAVKIKENAAKQKEINTYSKRFVFRLTNVARHNVGDRLENCAKKGVDTITIDSPSGKPSGVGERTGAINSEGSGKNSFFDRLNAADDDSQKTSARLLRNCPVSKFTRTTL